MPARRGRRRTQYAPPRRRSYARRAYGRLRHRVGKAKIPIEVVVAGISIPFTPAKTGYSMPVNDAKAQNWEGVLTQMKSGFLGMESDGSVDFWSLINPFNMESARYTKMLALAGLISKGRKRIVHLPIGRVPFVGKYLS